MNFGIKHYTGVDVYNIGDRLDNKNFFNYTFSENVSLNPEVVEIGGNIIM